MKVKFVFLIILFILCSSAEIPADTYTIDGSTVHQSIDGFGASSFEMTSLTEAQADKFFSITNGIGLSFLRMKITGAGGTSETSIAQQAVARGARVWAAPWSPPASWKTNNDVNNGGYLLEARYQDWADRLANFAVTMKNAGVDLYAISVQNESDYVATWESCLYTASQLHTFIPYLYNSLNAAGVGSVKILFPEQATWTFDLASDTMNDVTTRAMVSILGAHNYDQETSPSHPTDYGKSVWETEVSTFDAYDGSISNGLTWASRIHGFLVGAEANAWHYWWLISYGDNEGLATPSVYAKRMYALGNFSKFVRPGWKRIDVSGSGSVQVSAYKDPNSNSFAIVAINSGSSANTTFNLSGLVGSVVTPWITSSSLSLEAQTSVNISGSSFTYSLPASSITTFVNPSNPSDVTPPSIPTGLTMNAVSQTDAYFSWTGSTDNTGVAGYKVFRNGVKIGDVAVTSYHDINLTPATAYIYNVLAYDTAGNASGQSQPLSITTLPVDNTMPIISNIMVSNIRGTSARITWTTDKLSDSRVEYGTTTSYGKTVSNTTLVTSHGITLTGLTRGTLYHFRVRSNSAVSSDKTFRTSWWYW